MLDIAEFSWDFHAYDLIQMHLPELAQAINNQMAYAFQMSKHTWGNNTEHIDTTYFRQAILCYI